MKHSSLGGPSRFAGLVLGVLSLAVAPATAQEGRAAGEYNLGNGRLAIQGYDPVAYFDVGGAAPTKGRPEFALDHEGVVYRFATEANRTTFAAAPDTYEPAHGGWCSYAMSKNKKVAIDPEAFRIGEGRLLLFVDPDYVAFDGDWVATEHESLAKADKNWKAMTGESARKAPPGSWRLSNEWNLSQASLAIAGYDPVSYFPEGGGKPTKGQAKYALRHDGVLYRFASKEHAAAFQKDPAKYEPQHGGWCSYAMGANGEKVEVDPTAFRLTNGQLHLFYTGWFADTREDWDEDTPSLKRKADANWGKLLEKAQPTS
jgi:YHS domain-containing protein